jgi:Flp pilus assembly protein CpaB
MARAISNSILAVNTEFSQNRLRNQKKMLVAITLAFSSVLCAGVGISFLVKPGTSLASVPNNTTAPAIDQTTGAYFVDMVVTTRPVTVGQAIDSRLVRMERRPETNLQQPALRSLDDIKNLYASVNISPGTPLSPSNTTRTKPISLVTAAIPPGFRAVTINVDARTAVEGWARAGARVDVSWLSSINGVRALVPIVSNALVLSAERQLNAEQSDMSRVPTTVSLVVAEADARKIHLAVTSGQVSLSLRGDQDQSKGISLTPLTERDLLGGDGLYQARKDNKNLLTLRQPDGSMQKYALNAGKLIPVVE